MKLISTLLILSLLCNNQYAPTRCLFSLTELKSLAASNSQLPRQTEYFNAFIQRFSSNKEFQLSRIQFPLLWQEATNDENIAHRDSRTSWRYYELLKKETGYKAYIKPPTAQKPSEASVTRSCTEDCGFADTLYFKRIGGKWYCTGRSMMNG